MAIIYLDHSATTLPDEKTIADFAHDLSLYSANPASLHRMGQSAAKKLQESKGLIARALGCQINEVILTSGGSEAINTALKGYAAENPKRGRTIVAVAGEHAATRETLVSLERQGYTIRTVAIRSDGQVDLAQLAAAIDADTLMITALLVNNETGAIQSLEQIVQLRNEKRPLAAIHVDGVQACGKLPIHFARMGIELFSGSGHKFGAPKGMGFLLVKKGVRLSPLIHGGGQQAGLRGGTENPPLAATTARCLEHSVHSLETMTNHCHRLRNHFLEELEKQDVSYVKISPDGAVPQILNLAFPGLRGETMQHALEQNDIYVSTGSACSSHKKGPSDVLLAMGVSRQVAECAIRISLSGSNTISEMEQTAEAIKLACQKYRR